MTAGRTSPLKVLCVFGTRPEAIKMAPVVRGLRARPKDFKTIVVVTAQHRSMLDQVMKLFNITSDHDLNIMIQNQSLEHIVIQVMTNLPPLLETREAGSRPRARRHHHDVRRGAGRFLPARSRSGTWRPACAPTTWRTLFPRNPAACWPIICAPSTSPRRVGPKKTF